MGHLQAWFEYRNIVLWGVADLTIFPEAPLPRAVSWCMPMDRKIMASIENGPNSQYANEYARVNQQINSLSEELAEKLRSQGHRALALAASVRSDPENIRGDFPHKTAATRAGLGWIGRNCQLVTRQFGPWVRLATVFTDMELQTAEAIEKHSCGSCHKCVDACPAGALLGASWQPSVTREKILNARACDAWKKEHYFQFHKGHNCGICSSVCPWGRKQM